MRYFYPSWMVDILSFSRKMWYYNLFLFSLLFLFPFSFVFSLLFFAFFFLFFSFYSFLLTNHSSGCVKYEDSSVEIGNLSLVVPRPVFARNTPFSCLLHVTTCFNLRAWIVHRKWNKCSPKTTHGIYDSLRCYSLMSLHWWICNRINIFIQCTLSVSWPCYTHIYIYNMYMHMYICI